MRLFSSGNSSKKPAGFELICQEIDYALRQHRHRRQQQPHGIIIGLEKYRKLKEQSKARKTEICGRYNGMPIVVDSTERFRIAVF